MSTGEEEGVAPQIHVLISVRRFEGGNNPNKVAGSIIADVSQSFERSPQSVGMFKRMFVFLKVLVQLVA